METNFERRSFWAMFGLTVVTLGFYQIYYNVRTTDQLRRAGGYVPSLIFLYMSVAVAFFKLFLGLFNSFVQYTQEGLMEVKFAGLPSWATFLESPFLPIFIVLVAAYFWYHYIKSYCKLVKHVQLSKTIIRYFVLWFVFDYIELWLWPLLDYLTQYLPQAMIFSREYSVGSAAFTTLVTGGAIIYALYLCLMKYFFFQRGFNRYVEQQK